MYTFMLVHEHTCVHVCMCTHSQTHTHTLTADVPSSQSQGSSTGVGGSQTLSQDIRLTAGEISNTSDDEIEDFDDDVIW